MAQNTISAVHAYIESRPMDLCNISSPSLSTPFPLIPLLTFAAHGTEIIHGKKVPDDLMLYMASVQNNKAHVCGGFLISEDFVVTAAHCDKPNLSVVLGTHNLKKVNDGTMRYDVTKCNLICKSLTVFYLHPQLSRKAQLNERVSPIQIPRAEMKLKAKTKCRLAGWGSAKANGEVSNVLKIAEVLVLPNNVTCAVSVHNPKTGFCKGDSGGPLVCGGIATGLVSFNRSCDPDVPMVYTDVSKYASWIRKVLKQKKC
uniref:Mast cell protease 8 n=1 Tax=Fundulus heteroclitus TaxID=8078 RepID=A0A3Q2TR19_FUNHE